MGGKIMKIDANGEIIAKQVSRSKYKALKNRTSGRGGEADAQQDHFHWGGQAQQVLNKNCLSKS
jgi:hypothetical protein